MHSNLMTSIHTLLAHPGRPDRDALFKVFADDQASNVLACLAPTGSLLQIAAALRSGWAWGCDGWELQITALVAMITDPRCPAPEGMMSTWRRVSGTIGVLRDRTDALVTWAQQRLDPSWYADLATLLDPSDAAARLLVRSPFPRDIGTTLRRWSMATDPSDPTAWQAMIEPDMRISLHQSADPSSAFPAWGWNTSVDPDLVLYGVMTGLYDGWSPDHPSLRGRIGWLEHHGIPDPHIGYLALVASIGRSDALAEAVCARLGHDPSFIPRIAEYVPWSRLHPRIQTVIDTTMRRTSDTQWKRTWTCAIGRSPIMPDTTINASLLLWRIDSERWDDLDPSIRAALVSRINLPRHCYGGEVHPDLIAGGYCPDGRDVRYWNPNVPPDDLRAWAYADLFREQSTLQKARDLIVLLAGLPPDRRARFEAIIDWRLNGHTEPPAQPPWDWIIWASLPAADRQRRLRDRLRVLWGNRTTAPAYQAWMARSHLLDSVVIAIRDLLDSKQVPHILAALLAQIPVLRVHMPNPGPPLPFPDDLDSALRAQIERLTLAPDDQAYAAWGLWLLARAGDVGADLITLYPDVAAALAPLLNADQQKAVAASPAAQGWESVTFLSWVAACAPAQELPPPPRQRRIR